MRAFVTGANGLLGSHLCRHLLEEGHSVRGLVRKNSNRKALEGLAVELVEGDVRDASSMRAGADGCDVMFHVAAVFSYYGYDEAEMYRTAEEGSVIAAEAAKDAGIRRIVLTSSTSVLGWREGPETMTEEDDLSGEAPDYFVTKRLQEKTMLQAAGERGVEVVVVNPSMFIGPEDHRGSESLGSVTSYLADPLKLSFGGGINCVHVGDVARGHLLLLDKGTPGERHILCGENWEWKQFHRTISELCGVGGPRLSVGRRAAIWGATAMELGAKITRSRPMATKALAKMAGRYFWYDGSKAQTLGFEARGTRDALADTLRWLGAM